MGIFVMAMLCIFFNDRRSSFDARFQAKNLIIVLVRLRFKLLQMIIRFNSIQRFDKIESGFPSLSAQSTYYAHLRIYKMVSLWSRQH